VWYSDWHCRVVIVDSNHYITRRTLWEQYYILFTICNTQWQNYHRLKISVGLVCFVSKFRQVVSSLEVVVSAKSRLGHCVYLPFLIYGVLYFYFSHNCLLFGIIYSRVHIPFFHNFDLLYYIFYFVGTWKWKCNGCTIFALTIVVHNKFCHVSLPRAGISTLTIRGLMTLATTSW
jgi:hypothetical protein